MYLRAESMQNNLSLWNLHKIKVSDENCILKNTSDVFIYQPIKHSYFTFSMFFQSKLMEKIRTMTLLVALNATRKHLNNKWL